jgi:hypothetical protein
MLILITTLGIFTFTEAKAAREFESDLIKDAGWSLPAIWPFFTLERGE